MPTVLCDDYGRHTKVGREGDGFIYTHLIIEKANQIWGSISQDLKLGPQLQIISNFLIWWPVSQF